MLKNLAGGTPLAGRPLPRNPSPIVPAAGASAGSPVGNAPALRQVANGLSGSPARPAAPIHQRIQQLFQQVSRAENNTLTGTTTVLTCTKLPNSVGPAVKVAQQAENAVDCLINLVRKSKTGELCVVSPADPGKRQAEMSLTASSSVPREEAHLVLIQGLLASLKNVESMYPLESKGDTPRQVYSKNLQLRYGSQVQDKLIKSKLTGVSREEAQRDVLLDSKLPTSDKARTPFDVVTIAAIDRRQQTRLDTDVLYDGMLHQFAHAFAKARDEGIKTILLSVPGSDPHCRMSQQLGAPVDQAYLEILGCAVADAIVHFGAGLKVVLPSHGAVLDNAISFYRSRPQALPPILGRRFSVTAAQGAPALVQPMQAGPGVAQPPQLPPVGAALTQPKTMGNKSYTRETARMSQAEMRTLPKALRSHLNDYTKVSLHRVADIKAPSGGSQPFWILGHDRADPSKALISIELASGQREVFEMTYSTAVLATLAQMVGRSKAL